MNHKTIRTALALLFVSLLITAPRAQQPAPAAAKQSPEDRVELYQALLDLTNPWTVMCVAAHPDDEDGSSLIVMRRKFGAHTVSLFSTFGEGGQNAIGPELYEELGAIRARETMAAAEIQGSEPHFLGLKDFGYSKSADEAFKFWGHDEALRRMVLEIRKLHPDVIITNHSATSNDHGHHQATARLELEAFDAAADPKRFPEQLSNDVTVWQVQRLFVRARGNAQAQTDNSPVVTIDPNEQDPVRGVVYAEEALHALQQHATQGPWPKTLAEMAARFLPNPAVRPVIRYRLVREAKGTAPLPKESHNFLDGLRLPDNVAREITMPQWNSSLVELANNHAEALVQMIGGLRNDLFKTPIAHPADPQRRAMLKARVERALVMAAGIDYKAQPASDVAIPGAALAISIKISNSGAKPIDVSGCNSWTGSSPERAAANSQARKQLARNHAAPGAAVNLSNRVRIPAGTPINVPVSDHLYEPTGLGLVINTRCTIEVSGANLSIDRRTWIDVAPAVEVADVTPSLLGLSPDKTGDKSRFPFTVTLINHQNAPVNGQLIAVDVFGNPLDTMPVSLAAGEKRAVKFPVTQPLAGGRRNSVTFLVQSAKVSSSQMGVPVFSTEAHVNPNLRVGYIRGFDYSLANALTALGVESKELSVDDVKTADLQKYSTIIVDNRVYESQPELIAANQKLLDYANAGGTLVVFYHKSNEWNPDERRNRPQLAPYPLTLSDDRITDENAPITFIEPGHPLLNSPNKMGQEDFVGWIQERGLYYPKEWDAHYHALLQSNDPGEAPLKGGLLVADYGRGHYIYTSMVWYRELRAGVPGAYRMLANMISYGHANEGRR